MSIGNGKMVVELFSDAISVSVSRSAAGSRCGCRREDLGRLRQLLRRLLLALGRDHLGAPLALGLGLPRDRAASCSSGRSMSLIATFATLMPHGSVFRR